MPAVAPIAAALRGTGVGRVIVGMLNLKVRTEGVDAMSTLSGWLGNIRDKFVNLGVTAIFLDRLLMTLRRTWDALSEAVGATRVSEQSRQFSDFAQMLGVGVEQFQAFSVSARVFGANLNDVVDMFSQMQERVNDYRSGVKGVVELMQGTGIAAKDFVNKDVIERFELVAQAVKNVAPEKGIGIMQSFFGEEGQRQFGPWASKGPQAVIDAMKEAIDIGAVMSKQQIALGRDYAMQNNRLGMFFTALGNNFALMVIPALKEISIFITEIIGRLSKFFQRTGGPISDRLLQNTKKILDTLRQAIAWFDTHVMPFEEFLVRLGHGMLAFTAIMLFAFNARSGLGLLWFFKVALAISLMLESIAVYLRGGRSMFGTMLKESPALLSFMLTFKAVFDQLLGVVGDLGMMFSTLMQSWTGFIVIKTILSVIGAMLLALRIVVRAITALFLVFEGVLLSITSLISGLLMLLSVFVDVAFGTKFTDMLEHMTSAAGVGAMQAFLNAGKVAVGMDGEHYGGFAQTAMAKDALGPHAYNLLYGPGLGQFTQINNVNIPTTATAQSTADALDKFIASQRKAAFEAAQKGGTR